MFKSTTDAHNVLAQSPAKHSVPVYIGLRYIMAKRRNGFVAFVSLFAMFGMLLGTFALIVVLSVMNGFDAELKNRILRVVPHGFLTTVHPLHDWSSLQEKISDTPRLLASAPFVGGEALVSGAGVVKGLEVQGILPEQEKDISVVANFMTLGAIEDLKPGEYGIVLGHLLARSLGARIGDRVVLTLPQVSVSPVGIFPRAKRFTLVGTFEVQATVDETLALIHLNDAQTLFRRGGAVDGLHLKFDDIYHSASAIQTLVQQLGKDYKSKDWSQTQGSLFQAVKMEKLVTGILLSIIIAVAAFNIVTSLVMMVAEKRSDIAVLRTLGLTRQGIVSIFVIQGSSMGGIGVLLGVLLGVPCAIYLPNIMSTLELIFGFHFFDPGVYFVTQIPSVWLLSDTLLVACFALIVSLLATFYPATRAAKIEPAEALSYDV